MTSVSHYTKLAVLVMRSIGVLIVVYGLLMLGVGIVVYVAGWSQGSQPGNLGVAGLVWLGAYVVAGALLLVLARPLGAMIGRSLDEPEDATGGQPPAAL